MKALRDKGGKLPFNSTHLRVACVGISLIMGLIGVFFLSTLGLPFFITVLPALAILYVHVPIMIIKR